jgi:acetylornithine deacetylase
MPDALERVWTAIDARRGEAVELLQELVRTRSVNPNYPGISRDEHIGGETRVNEILQVLYADAGLETHWVAEDHERRNLVGIRRGSGGGRSLLLNGHIDTVPPTEADRWLCGSPWTPEIRDGRMYGLGSTDMKASAVSMWLAARALADTGISLLGDLQLHSVVGEETAEYHLGTLACVRAGFRADAAVVTEPTNPPRPLTITTVSAGFCWLKVVIEGKSTHCGNRPLSIRPGGPGDAIGVNALEKGVKIVQALQELERQWGHSKAHPYFPPGWFTIMPGIFRSDAGVPFPAFFPDRAELHWLLWYPPDEDDEDVMREIEDYVSAACALDSWLSERPPLFEWLMRYPGMFTPWEHDLPQTMARVWERLTGEVVPPPSPAYPVNFGAAMEGTWLEREGIPSIVFGPGDLRVAHSRDESVAVDEVFAAAKGLAGCAIEWCGIGSGGED